MSIEPVIRFPIRCPVCMKESLTEHRLGPIAEALLCGSAICLTSPCHGFSWNAGEVEREQIRQYLGAGARANAGSLGA
jgi:hypothetical protein